MMNDRMNEFYYYQKPVSCNECIDTVEAFGDAFPDCKKCHQNNCVRVKVLQFVSGLFHHNAIIQYLDTGKIATVPIRRLTYGGVIDGQSV